MAPRLRNAAINSPPIQGDPHQAGDDHASDDGILGGDDIGERGNDINDGDDDGDDPQGPIDDAGGSENQVPSEAGDGSDVAIPSVDKDDHQVQVLASIAKVLAKMSSKTDESTPKGTDVSRPTKFSGRDRHKLRTFIAQCMLVFRASPKKFDTDTKKITYATSYLDDLAFGWYENFLELDEEPAWFHDWKLFKDELQSNFGLINAAPEAERQLRLLKMRSDQHVVEYITNFQTQANRLNWNDEALLSQFRQGLPSRIKDELARVPTRDLDMLQFREVVIDIDERYWERVAERKNESNHTEVIRETRRDPGSTKSTYTKVTTKDPASTRSKYDPKRSVSTTVTTYNPDKAQDKPLPLDSAGHVKQAEKERRAAKGLCAYCGDKHNIDDCPKRPARAMARSSKATFSIQAQSGKE